MTKTGTCLLPFISADSLPLKDEGQLWNENVYAVIAKITCLHWLTATADKFDQFTDRYDLVSIFDPVYMMPDLSLTKEEDVLRWAARLSTYSYTCFHVCGEDSIWADILGRWSTHPQPTPQRLLFVPLLLSAADHKFEWPQAMKLSEVQAGAELTRQSWLAIVYVLWKNSSGALRVPDSRSDIHLRLFVTSRTSADSHRDHRSTKQPLLSHSFLKHTPCRRQCVSHVFHTLPLNHWW